MAQPAHGQRGMWELILIKARGMEGGTSEGTTTTKDPNQAFLKQRYFVSFHGGCDIPGLTAVAVWVSNVGGGRVLERLCWEGWAEYEHAKARCLRI